MSLLLAMQAAGMITDMFGTFKQANMIEMAYKVQSAGMEANLAQTRLESQEASLAEMKQLRQNLGSQIAANAARGTSTVGGSSAFLSMNESVATANADEKIRKLNLLGKENQLRAGAAMSSLQYSSDSSKLWSSFAQRSVNRFPSSVSGWGGMTGSTGSSQGFGLTSIGGR